MILQEIFDSESTAKVKYTQTATLWKATAKLSNGDPLVVKAKKISIADQLIWEISFEINKDYEATHKFMQYEVLPLVISILKKFDEDVSPQQIYFSADIEKRARIYEKVLKRFFNGWETRVTNGFLAYYFNANRKKFSVTVTEKEMFVNVPKKPGFIFMNSPKRGKYITTNTAMDDNPQFFDAFELELATAYKKVKDEYPVTEYSSRYMKRMADYMEHS